MPGNTSDGKGFGANQGRSDPANGADRPYGTEMSVKVRAGASCVFGAKMSNTQLGGCLRHLLEAVHGCRDEQHAAWRLPEALVEGCAWVPR